MNTHSYRLVVPVVILLSACTPEHPSPDANAGGTAPMYSVLDNDLARFKSDFNAMSDKLRMVFISGPSCSVCLRGMDDLNRSIVESVQNDSRVHTFVIYVPALGANEDHAAKAVSLIPGARVNHYWDPGGGSGLTFQEALDIPMYAWDVWMLYEPGTRWQADGPPPPAFWQHQLQGLPRETYLDAREFAQAVNARREEK